MMRGMTNRDRIAKGLAGLCGALWLLAAINPVDRQAWWLENLLLILFALALLLARKRLQFSTISFAFICFFFVLHIVGAHYTYAQMPLGLWARDVFHLSRNPYDRITHGAFGFLLVFPLRELLLRFAVINRRAACWLPPIVILAASGLFEILESIAAEIIAPGAGAKWLGGQGDEWDAQNDMLMAFAGAVVMMCVVALVARASTAHDGKIDDKADRAASRRPFAENRFLQILISAYLVLWLMLALRPVDRGDWFLENLLVFASLALLVSTYRFFQFSNRSYALGALFLVLHAIGAHYTYAEVPLGFWLRDLLHLERNHFDRAIHFGFGLLLLAPMRELFAHRVIARVGWALALAVAFLTGMSSFFEIVEAVIAQLVHPDLGAAYLGTQGDIWDAQKDTAAAFLGALLTAVVLCSLRVRPAPADASG